MVWEDYLAIGMLAFLAVSTIWGLWMAATSNHLPDY